MLIFAPIEQKLHVSSGEQIAHAMLAGTQDSSNPAQYVPLWNLQLGSSSQKQDNRMQILHLRQGGNQLEKSTNQKLDM